jgi:putative transposase
MSSAGTAAHGLIFTPQPPRASRLAPEKGRQAAAVQVRVQVRFRGSESTSESDDHNFEIMEDLPNDDQCAKGTQHWPHAPPHRLSQSGVYFLTARAAEARHLLADDAMKDWFQDKLFTLTNEFGWKLEAWAILSNHYHLIGHSPKGPDGAESLREMIRKLHSLTTQELNRRENQPGRTRLWQNFRETCLTHQRSYLARLHYVHQNAVHHKLVAVGSDYPWCSAAEFRKAVTPAWLKTITSFQYDEIATKDGD